MQPLWTLLHPHANFEMLGFIPDMLNDRDQRPAKEQFNERYSHGGGWRKTSVKFEIAEDRGALFYPEDPPMQAIAKCNLRDEEIYLYESAWVVIYQRDGSYEICRMD